MPHLNASHLEVRPTRPDDDAGDGKIWTVYLVNRVYNYGFRFVDGPLEESLTPYSQHANFEEADISRRESAYC